jgi:hypothetical protein
VGGYRGGGCEENTGMGEKGEDGKDGERKVSCRGERGKNTFK